MRAITSALFPQQRAVFLFRRLSLTSSTSCFSLSLSLSSPCLKHLPAPVAAASDASPVVAAAATATPANLGADLWNQTYYPRAGDTFKGAKRWYVVDAEGATLGRLATLVAGVLRGKNEPLYTPSMNTGAYVVVVNADKVAVSGGKADQKKYYRHSGRPGGQKEETFRQLQARIPERIVERAVRGMLPSGKLGNELFRQLKVYKGTEHPHAAQGPVDLTARIGKGPKAAAAAAASL